MIPKQATSAQHLVSENSVDDWPVDVQRMDITGEVDLGQLDFNLSLSPRERIAQNDNWVAFIHLARRAGQHLHGKPTSA